MKHLWTLGGELMIGVVGLGRMGLPISMNLLRAGYPVAAGMRLNGPLRPYGTRAACGAHAPQMPPRKPMYW